MRDRNLRPIQLDESTPPTKAVEKAQRLIAILADPPDDDGVVESAEAELIRLAENDDEVLDELVRRVQRAAPLVGLSHLWDVIEELGPRLHAALPALVDQLDRDNDMAEPFAIAAVAADCPMDAVDRLRERLEEQPELWRAAGEILADLAENSGNVVAAVRTWLSEPLLGLRAAALYVGANLGWDGPEFDELAGAAVESQEPVIRAAGLWVLGRRIGTPSAEFAARLAAAMLDEREEVTRVANLLLPSYGSRAWDEWHRLLRPPLTRLLNEALTRLADQQDDYDVEVATRAIGCNDTAGLDEDDPGLALLRAWVGHPDLREVVEGVVERVVPHAFRVPRRS